MRHNCVLQRMHAKRQAGNFEQLYHNSWRVPAEEPVGKLFGWNGPAELVAYDWDRARGVVLDELFVQLRSAVLRGPND